MKQAGLNIFEYSIARAFAQMLKESEKRTLTPKEEVNADILALAVDRYAKREAA